MAVFWMVDAYEVEFGTFSWVVLVCNSFTWRNLRKLEFEQCSEFTVHYVNGIWLIECDGSFKLLYNSSFQAMFDEISINWAFPLNNVYFSMTFLLNDKFSSISSRIQHIFIDFDVFQFLPTFLGIFSTISLLSYIEDKYLEDFIWRWS